MSERDLDILSRHAPTQEQETDGRAEGRREGRERPAGREGGRDGTRAWPSCGPSAPVAPPACSPSHSLTHNTRGEKVVMRPSKRGVWRWREKKRTSFHQEHGGKNANTQHCSAQHEVSHGGAGARGVRGPGRDSGRRECGGRRLGRHARLWCSASPRRHHFAFSPPLPLSLPALSLVSVQRFSRAGGPVGGRAARPRAFPFSSSPRSLLPWLASPLSHPSLFHSASFPFPSPPRMAARAMIED